MARARAQAQAQARGTVYANALQPSPTSPAHRPPAIKLSDPTARRVGSRKRVLGCYASERAAGFFRVDTSSALHGTALDPRAKSQLAVNMPELEPFIPSDWGDAHRSFLQSFMARGTLTFREARPIMAAIFTAGNGQGHPADPSDITEAQFRALMSKMREAVAPLDYDVRSTTHQTTREQIWALINAHSDPSTQLATSRSPDEIAFIKRVLDAMFETYNTQRQEVMAVTAAQARQVARPPARSDRNEDADGENEAPHTQHAVDRGLKHSEVEKLLPSMVEEGWFEQSNAGFYSLSARSLMELNTWLLEAYNDPDASPDNWQRIKSCEACKDIVTVGQRCPERDCNVRLHDACADAFWRTRRTGQVCPKCQTAWTGTNFVGERSVTETAAAHRRRANGPRRSNGNGSMANNEAEQDVAEDQEDT